MSAMDYQVMELANGKPVKMWTQGVAVEDEARAQLRNTAQMPFIFRHVAVMPDVHLGKGATVGWVIATRAAIVPAAVGVDIGCGMMAVRTTLIAYSIRPLGRLVKRLAWLTRWQGKIIGSIFIALGLRVAVQQR